MLCHDGNTSISSSAILLLYDGVMDMCEMWTAASRAMRLRCSLGLSQHHSLLQMRMAVQAGSSNRFRQVSHTTCFH